MVEGAVMVSAFYFVPSCLNTCFHIMPTLPQLDINTVAAGGGSRLFFRSGLFAVGPDSAGANPGPTCYSKGK